ncbi:MAG: phospholipase D-like domain-containing protein, partial [bacterium]
MKIKTIIIVGCVMFTIALYILQPNKPELSGTHAAHAIPVSENDIQLLIDSTAFDPQSGNRIICQKNFDTVLALIKGAKKWIYVDFFLWNQWQGSIPENHRKLSKELADALIHKKQDCPKINILVLTDPINRIYGNMEPEFFHRMADAGIGIVFADLSMMNDSNLICSPPINILGAHLKKISWINRLLDRAFLPNVMDFNGNQMSLRQMGRMFFFKANHRKVIITDTVAGDWQMLVTSFNPADGSSAHSNCGLLVLGDLALAALDTEISCVEWSAINPRNCLGDVRYLLSLFRMSLLGINREAQGHKGTRCLTAGNTAVMSNPASSKANAPTIEWLTEGAILTRIMNMLKSASPGDEIRIAIFYLSERRVIEAIKFAAKKGASIRIIMDANRDAFGHIKIGIPNRPVAAELLNTAKKHNLNISIRWADTHGEQFHHKAVCIVNKNRQKYQFMCGSANWTRRNLADLNLEANLFVDNAPKITSGFIEYFDRAW